MTRSAAGRRQLWAGRPGAGRAVPALVLAGALGVALAPVTARGSRGPGATSVDVLEATGGLPARLVGTFEDPVGFAQATTGDYFVLDRRAHTVYAVDAARTSVRKILQVGFEEGRVLRPAVLALSRDDVLAVGDAPGGLERIQYFDLDGRFLGGFYLNTRKALTAWLTAGPLVLSGVGSMSFTGKTFLVNRPGSGALISEYETDGTVNHQIGVPRATGHEDDPELPTLLNLGLPLADPAGGYYFIFQTGVPMFRKYDASGRLVFERHIEGVELDGLIQTLPTTWPRRESGSGLHPVVSPLIRTAAVDPYGRLWVSLTVPFTYVYDANGEKVSVVQFHAAGTVSPESLFFSPRGTLLVTPGCYEFAVPTPPAD
jgi:hypothetical protein